MTRSQLDEFFQRRLELQMDAHFGPEGAEPLADHLRRTLRKEAAGSLAQALLDTIAYATEGGAS